MASITTSKATGHRAVQFIATDRRRKTIRLGKTSKRHAEAVKLHVEHLVAAAVTGNAPDLATARWLGEVGDDLHAKLANAGLVVARGATSLGPHLDGYMKDRRDVKPSTRLIWGHTIRNLKTFFGPASRLADITANDADRWRRWLDTEQGLSVNTIRRRTGLARQFFRAAVRAKLIESNPFDGLDCGVRSNRERVRFIPRQSIDAVMRQCPDHEWRLLLALSRYGGLRCPSEHLALTWADVDWSAGRFTVRATKTEHCEGGGVRVVPIFPELYPYLREAFEQAEAGAHHVITRYRLPNTNLRTMLMRYIERAGLSPWPKLFQNLRSTRQTELEQHFPTHVVCYWMGNSVAVAREHYLQVPDQFFNRALHNPTQPTPESGGEPEQKTAATGPNRRATAGDGGDVSATGPLPPDVNHLYTKLLASGPGQGAAECAALRAGLAESLSRLTDHHLRMVARFAARLAEREEAHAQD